MADTGSGDARAGALRIALTGGIGSGKTTVARLFAELGVTVIDADEIAHQLMMPGGAAVPAILREFGAGLAADGGIDRRRLGEIVFAEPRQRRRLEALLHPMIRAGMQRAAAGAPPPYCVLVIPLLVESGQRDIADRVLVVDVDEHTQFQRVRARDRRSDDQIRAILAAQAGRAERLAAADDVLTNRGDLHELRGRVEDLHRRYLALAAAAPARNG